METNERAELYMRIVEMRAAGARLSAIAASIGVAANSQVCRYIQEGCWEKYPLQNARYELFEALIKEGWNAPAIAKRCYISKGAVHGVLNRGRNPEYDKTRRRKPRLTTGNAPEPSEPRKVTLPALRFLSDAGARAAGAAGERRFA